MKKIITDKEQFENDVKNAKYADEVCGHDYYYKEEGDQAFLYAGRESTSDYIKSYFPTFAKMKETYGILLSCFFIEQEISSPKELRVFDDMNVEDLYGNKKFFTTYCDFLFCSGDLATNAYYYEDKEVEVDDEPKFATIGAEHTDINAFSSMINHIKEELIRKIKGVAGCLEFERFAFNPRYGDNSTFCTYCIDGENFFFCKDDDVFWFENEDGDSLGDLDDCVVEELLYLYSKLHK